MTIMSFNVEGLSAAKEQLIADLRHCDDVDNRLDNTCEVIRQETVQVTLYQ